MQAKISDWNVSMKKNFLSGNFDFNFKKIRCFEIQVHFSQKPDKMNK